MEARAPATLQAPLRRDAFSMFRALQRGASCSVFLDSAAAPAPNASWSYLAAGDFPVLEARDGAWPALTRALPPRPRVGLADGPPFRGGFLGMLGYDLAREFERIPRLAGDPLGLPRVWGLLVDALLAVDHRRGLVHAVAVPRPGEADKEAEARAYELLERAQGPVPGLRGRAAGGVARSSVGEPGYLEMVRRGKEFVDQGHVFQANLAHWLSWPSAAEPLWLFDRLRRGNPSPFAFYLDAGDWQLVSCSPERLVQVEADRVATRPIAGTYPRGASEAEDAVQRERIRADPKERAEHTMLVDLERNDLGRVCRFGSVEVEEFMTTEEYSHVVHLVSSVAGGLRPGLGALDAVRACFPGGTITGAPKVRAMEVIEELEPQRRGFYTGSVGWVGFDGAADLNIVIRTILCKESACHAPVGAGIVADSNPSREWRETLHKARALLQAAGVEAP